MSTRVTRRSGRIKKPVISPKEELPDPEPELAAMIEETEVEVPEIEQISTDQVESTEDGSTYIVLANGSKLIVNEPKVEAPSGDEEEIDDEGTPMDIYEFPSEEMAEDEKTVPGYLCKGCYRIFTTKGGLKRHLRACSNLIGNLPLDKLTLLENSSVVTGDSMGAEEFEQEGICHCCGEDIETAHVDGEFSCDRCEKSFKLKSSLERHLRIIHSEGTLYDCPECNARCPDKGTLAKHMYTHTGLKPYECPTCHKEFTRRYHLIRHNYQTGCNGQERPSFPCQVCGRIFNRKDNLREHLRAHAGQTKRKKKYACTQCTKAFFNMKQLKNHLDAHEKYNNALTPSSADDGSALNPATPKKRGRKSTRLEKVEGDKPYPCDICQTCFATSGAMKKHRRRHTGERPYECKECYARFAAKETLNRHMQTHTGHKPHVCQYCNKSFIQASQLKAHLFHHTGENGFTCDICKKIFNRKARLDLHIKYIHEGADPFECEDCHKHFVRKEDLNRHRLLHTGVKPHKCPICSKGFTMKSSLKIHLLTHTKEPPRSCQFCGRAFIRKDCLIRHMRAKHREEVDETMLAPDGDKKKIQAQLLAAAASGLSNVLEDEVADYIEDDEEDEEWNVDDPGESTAAAANPTCTLSETVLQDYLMELLNLLVDEETLVSFGYPHASVQDLLHSVISRCGSEPAVVSETMSLAECLRENAKLLFTVVIDDAAVKQLLNNQTVDQVIEHVIRLSKTTNS